MSHSVQPSFSHVTAFDVRKFSEDISQIHGMYTYDVPDTIFVAYENNVRQTTTDASARINSVDGELVIDSGNTLDDAARLETKRHPRLHPNRGQLFSPSIFLPSKATLGTIRRWGSYTTVGGNPYNGYYFEWSQYDKFGTALDQNYLWACVVSIGVVQYKEKIKYEEYIHDIDLEKGFLADIQGQWRGVGNFFFFLGNPDTGKSVRVHTINALGERLNLTIANPALPATYESIHKGNACQIKSGCVDVSTEGGQTVRQEYCAAITDGSATVVTDTPIIAIRVPPTYKTLHNTRDSQLHKVRIITGNNKVDFKLWRTNDETALGGTAVWTDVKAGCSIQKKDVTGGGGPTLTFTPAKATELDRGAAQTNSTEIMIFDDVKEAPIWLSHDDILILSGTGANAVVDAVIIVGEEI